MALEPDREYTLVVAKRGRGGIVRRGTLRGRQIRTKSQFEIRAGDFLISRRQIVHGACGVVPQSLDGAIVSNEYSVIRTVDSLLVTYLGALAATEYLQRTFYHSSVGVAVEKMVFRDQHWLRYRIHLPPVSEQAAILKAIDLWSDSLRVVESLGRRAHARKRALLQLLISGAVRFPQFVGETWGLCRLGDFATLQSGIAKNPNVLAESIERPYLRVANVLDGRLDLREVKTIRVRASDVSRYELRAGDVLMNEGGAAGQLGRGAVWNDEIHGCLHQNHVFAIRPDPTVVIPEFLSAWTSSDLGRRYFARVAKQSTIATLDSKQLLAATTPVPSINEQHAIVGTTGALDREILLLAQLRGALERQRSGIAGSLMSGRLRATGKANR